MVPPKYKFYSGKALNLAMISGKFIDPITFEEVYDETAPVVSSNKTYVTTEAIYVNYNVSDDLSDDNTRAENVRLFMFDKNGTGIGRMSVNGGPKICELVKGTVRIVLQFESISNKSIQKVHKSFAKTGFSEVYEIAEISPKYKELSKKYSKESGQEFFRVSLEGKINLYNDDFELVQNANLDDMFIFLIEKLNTKSNSWREYYKGQFNKTDCKFDKEKKKCELKLTALDAYSKILEGYENTYDLIKLAPELTEIDMHKRPLMQVYIKGASTISNFLGGTYWEDDVIEAVDSDADLIHKYFFSYIRAGNEFYVEGAGISEVNGVYAGINGYWPQQNGYTCYMDTTVNVKTNLYIKRDSDNVILYKSTKQYTNIYEGDCYIAREDVEMVNVNDSKDKFIIKSPFVYKIYQRLLCDVDTITDSEGTKTTFNIPIDDFVSDNKNYKKCIGLKGGKFYCTSKTVTEPTKYGLNDYGEYFTNHFIPWSLGKNRPLPICRSTWANASLWYVYDVIQYELWEENLRKKYTLKDSYSIDAVIKVLLSKICPSVRFEATPEYSQFLYSATNPVSSVANRFYVFMTQKTNILKSQYDQAAQKAEISFEDVMNMLRDCFRCYWFIYDNKLIIEHISWFMNGCSYYTSPNTQLDFTKIKDMFNKRPTAYFQSETEFDKSILPSRYEFNWADDVTEPFDQVTIDVKAKYVQQDKKEEVNVNQFTSDIDFMLLNPDNFSNDGFALLCAVKNGSKYELPILKADLVDENGDGYQAISQNWYASWAYLTSRFYMSDMPAYKVEINVLNSAYVLNLKRCMKHVIEFISAEDLDELQLIYTSFGGGKIDEYTVDMNTRMAKVTLLYEPQ